jgi:CheY-like chemotaxis protein
MAQDFNGLLTGIMGYSEHLSGELEDNELLHNEVDEIRKAAEAAVMRTRQLLMFSRAAALRSEPLDINTVIVQCQARLGKTLGEDKALEVKLDPSLGEVRADREQVETILDSLVANASDAMHPGSTLIIETSAVDLEGEGGPSSEGRRAGHFARLTVADQGSGMEEDVLERIFEPFFTTREGKSGMGLSVVYGSVRQHSGWVEVSSQVERGTEFNLYFPAQAARRKETSRESAGKAGLQGGGEKVLIVEDDEIVRTMVTKVLRDRGYTVSAVASAAEARETFEEKQRDFDLIFTDIVLPDANGLSLAEELREQNPDVRILVTSGYTDRQSQMAGLAEKNFLLLEKPYALFDLLTAIKDSLDQPVGAES